MSKLDRLPSIEYGLTGTLDGTKTHKLVLEGLFGTVNKVVYLLLELQDKETVGGLERYYGLILNYDAIE